MPELRAAACRVQRDMSMLDYRMSAPCPKCRTEMIYVAALLHPQSPAMRKTTFVCYGCNRTRNYALSEEMAKAYAASHGDPLLTVDTELSYAHNVELMSHPLPHVVADRDRQRSRRPRLARINVMTDDLSDLEIAVLCDLLDNPRANLKAHKRAVLDQLAAKKLVEPAKDDPTKYQLSGEAHHVLAVRGVGISGG